MRMDFTVPTRYVDSYYALTVHFIHLSSFSDNLNFDHSKQSALIWIFNSRTRNCMSLNHKITGDQTIVYSHANWELTGVSLVS